MEKKNNLIFKDILWYLIGNVIPLLIGFIKSPIYTRIFSPEDFGRYSLVLITFTYLSGIGYSWIISCAFRYHFQYKKEGKINSLYTNLLFLFSVFSLIILLITCFWYLYADNQLIKELIILCFLQFFTSEILSLFLVKPRLDGKSFFYNSIQTVRAVGSFGLLILLTFVFNYGIEAFLISNICLNTLLILIFIIPEIITLKISPKLICKQELKTLVEYGKIGLIINVSMLLLISSDRFLIEHFSGLKEVGIYNQNYNIAQISICGLINVFWSALNPYILPMMDNPEINDSQKDLFKYFKLYFFIFFPITIYFVLFAKEIAEIMLGMDFRIGYKIIYWIAISEFITGLHFLPTLKLKFKHKLRYLSIYYLLAIGLNIGLNVLFIPKFGYQAAAVSTISVNLFLFVAFYKQAGLYYLSNSFFDKNFMYCICILVVQSIIHFFFSKYNFPIHYYIIEAVVFVAIYLFFH